MDNSPVPPSTYRNLSDKLYDKRKLGALEIEQLVKELNNNKNEEGIRGVIRILTTDFADSPQGNNKKGGLIGLAAAAIGMGAVSFVLFVSFLLLCLCFVCVLFICLFVYFMDCAVCLLLFCFLLVCCLLFVCLLTVDF
jgi:hypothetical protein